MTRKTYSVESEPIDDVYDKLIEVASQFCKRGMLVTRATVDMSRNGLELLQRLIAFNGEEQESSEWPGTRLLRGAATVVTFDLNRESQALLKSVRRLYGWQQPQWPEDLCLLRGDGSTWLGSTAHEEDAFLELDEGEVLHLQRSIPEMTITPDMPEQ
jgi:hypothetical protein